MTTLKKRLTEALFSAVEHGVSNDIIKKLLHAGAEVNEKDNEGNTLLHYAMMYRQEEKLVGLLLKTGINVNIQNKDGCTPLHLAMMCDRPASSNNFLESVWNMFYYSGANLETKNNIGKSPLDYAYSNRFLAQSDKFKSIVEDMDRLKKESSSATALAPGV